MGKCKWENYAANGFRIVLHWKISTLSNSCDENVHQVCKSECTHAQIAPFALTLVKKSSPLNFASRDIACTDHEWNQHN